MEYIAKDRGLTHNFLTVLLESGQFTTLPPITNKKSAAIMQFRIKDQIRKIDTL